MKNLPGGGEREEIHVRKLITQVNLFLQLIPFRAITNSRQFYGSTGKSFWTPKCGSIVKHARRGREKKVDNCAPEFGGLANFPLQFTSRNRRGHVIGAHSIWLFMEPTTGPFPISYLNTTGNKILISHSPCCLDRARNESRADSEIDNPLNRSISREPPPPSRFISHFSAVARLTRVSLPFF